MMTQNLISGFISKTDMSKEVQKSLGGKSFSSQFKDTLDSTVEKSRSGENSNNSHKYRLDVKSRSAQQFENRSLGKAVEAKEEGMERSKAFEKAVDRTTDRKTDKTKQMAEDKAECATVQKDKSIEDGEKLKKKAMEEALSEVLGISSEELRKLMALLGINLEELDGGVNAEIIAHKVSDYLGLSPDEEMTLSKMIALTQKEVEQVFEGIKATSDAEKHSMVDEIGEDGAKLDHVKAMLVQEDTPVMKNELEIKISAALKEMENKLKEDSNGFSRQIISKVEEVLEEGANEAAVKTSDIEDESIEQIMVEADSEDGIKVEVVKAPSEETTENKDNADRDENDSKEASVALKDSISQQVTTKDDGDVQFEAISNASIQETAGHVELEQGQNRISVTKKEIVEQVVQKAKVVLDGEKSEMVIDLKPDHLGKLELKIVTERGMVVAKFVAENEQVKAALESNMNMLKESLEKQGFSVEGFSVAVGDNKNRGDNMNQGAANRRIVKDKLQVSGIASVEGMQKVHESINPYSYGDSSINLTA